MITEKRKQQIFNEAKEYFLDLYSCGQLNEDCLDESLLKEEGYTEEEIKLYIKTFNELMFMYK